MKRILAIAAATLMLLTPVLAGPGRGGGSSSSSSRSSSSSSRSSYGPPSRSASPSPSPSRSYGSYSSKPSQPAQASKPSGYGTFGKSQPAMPVTAKPQAQAAWARSQQATSAAAESKASLAKFKAPAAPAPAPAVVASTPAFSRTVTTVKPTYQTYVVQRQTYYRSYSPPVYVYNVRPSYGVWDTMFMFYMLDSMNHNMYYNHRNDSDWAAWRADADRQAQTNADLKAKLAAMDAKVKELEAQKAPVDPSYMPQGVDPSVAMAQNVAEQTLTKEPTPVNPDSVQWEQPSHAGAIMAWIFGLALLAVIVIFLVNRAFRSTGSTTGRYGL